jgi:tRNA (guanosine-2'-O-)-methyltransferase
MGVSVLRRCCRTWLRLPDVLWPPLRLLSPPPMKPHHTETTLGSTPDELVLSTPWGADWDPERIIERLEPLALPRRCQRFEEVIAGRLGSVTLLLDELSDPHNRAAVVRSCDAFGLQELHSVQPAKDFSIHHGVAAGTERWVDVFAHESAAVAVQQLERRGFELIQTHPKGELTPEDLARVPRLALILGNEHRGIDPVFASAARRSVRIPMRGFVESLNVSVSAAVLLAAATRGRPGDLPETWRRHLYARALYHSVPRASEVLDAFGA